jgi:HAD superfamily hydrolase (TIGR01484 family)
MRPLSELPASALAPLTGVIFDVDETLTTRGRLHVDALEALWSLHDAGLRLAAVTGRPLGWADAMAATLPIDIAIGENGAGFAHRLPSGAIAHGYFDDEKRRARHAEVLRAVREAVARELPDVRVACDQASRRCDLAFDVGEGTRLPEDVVARIVAIIESHGARVLVSSVHAHVLPGEWDKARGTVHALREALGIELDRTRWLFVGDSGNDAAAFAFFELTVGVANVREHLGRLPVPPRWITRAERGAGFAELARHVLVARSGHG